MRILVVDDEPMARRFFKAAMEEYGDIQLANDGEEAIEYVKEKLRNKENYDVIFLDIRMPRVDGHEALRNIRKLENDQPANQTWRSKIVMITSYSSKKAMTQSFEDGCEYYLTKPIFPRELDEIMRVIRQEKEMTLQNPA